MPNDRVPKHKQRLVENKEMLQKKVSKQPAPSSVTKEEQSPRQNENTLPSGAIERENRSEEEMKKKGKSKSKEEDRGEGR